MKNTQQPRVTLAELERLIARDRKTWSQAATALGISLPAIQARAAVLGFVHPLRRRKLPTKAQVAAAIRPYATYAEIGRTLNLSANMTRYLVTKYRLPGPGKRKPRPTKAALAADLKSKHTLDALVAKYQLSKQIISKLITQYGLPKPWRRPDRSTMRRYALRGLSVSDVVDITGLHISTICRICRDYRIRLKRKKLAAPRKQRKLKGVLSAATRAKIAAAHRGRTGHKSSRWKGGHVNGGYKIGGSRGYVHRNLAEALLGRKLRRDEIVHHMDRNRSNNDPANLLVIRLSSHMALHAAMRRTANLDQMFWLNSTHRAFVYLGDITK